MMGDLLESTRNDSNAPFSLVYNSRTYISMYPHNSLLNLVQVNTIDQKCSHMYT